MSNEKTTPAAGGAHISRSHESESHVVAATASPEVMAVVEHPKQDEMPASGGSDEMILWDREEPFPGPFKAVLTNQNWKSL